MYHLQLYRSNHCCALSSDRSKPCSSTGSSYAHVSTAGKFSMLLTAGCSLDCRVQFADLKTETHIVLFQKQRAGLFLRSVGQCTYGRLLLWTLCNSSRNESSKMQRPRLHRGWQHRGREGGQKPRRVGHHYRRGSRRADPLPEKHKWRWCQSRISEAVVIADCGVNRQQQQHQLQQSRSGIASTTRRCITCAPSGRAPQTTVRCCLGDWLGRARTLLSPIRRAVASVRVCASTTAVCGATVRWKRLTGRGGAMRVVRRKVEGGGKCHSAEGTLLARLL